MKLLALMAMVPPASSPLKAMMPRVDPTRMASRAKSLGTPARKSGILDGEAELQAGDANTLDRHPRHAHRGGACLVMLAAGDDSEDDSR